MSTRHFVLWVNGDRTHVASRNAYRRGEAAWRHDDALTVRYELDDALGWWEGQTPINGPFPAFDAGGIHAVAEWLDANGYTARILQEPPR